MNQFLYPSVFTLLIIFQTFQSVCAFDVVVGFDKPPYVLSNQNSGFELELVSKILNKMGIQPSFLMMPYNRNERMFEGNIKADAMMTVNPNVISNKSMLTDTYITYQNVAISLKSNQIKVDSIADLANYNVIAFPLAEKLLGGAYENAVAKSGIYTEVQDQLRQLKLFYQQRYDVIIIDANIFNYYRTLYGSLISNEEVTIHRIFEPNHYSLAFRNKKYIKLFNSELKQFKRSNQYQLLVKKYSLLSEPLK